MGRLQAAQGAFPTMEAHSLRKGMHASQPRYRAWQRLKNLLSKLDPEKPRDHLQANAMAALFQKRELTTEDQAERAFNAFTETDLRLRVGTSHAN